MHRALQRQLKRTLGVADEAALRDLVAMAQEAARRADLMPEVASLLAGFGALMERVAASYDSNDRDIELRTRSLDISSEELNAANARLRGELAIRREALASIRQTLAAMAGRGLDGEAASGDDLAALTTLLGDLVRERERERSQLDHLKFALDQHAIVSITDVEGNILYANDRFCASSGYRREELLGRNHRIVRSMQHPPEFFRAMWDTLGRGQVWRGEICNRSRDGSRYWVAATLVPFVDNVGVPYQYIGILTDISARKQAEEALILARDAAQAADRAKGEFLAAISHEIHTPMNAVLGMTELALDAADDVEQRGYLETARSSAKTLLTLLDEIVDFARIDAGQAAAQRQAFDAAALLRELGDLYAPRARDKGLQFACTLAAGLHPRVWGDPARLRKLLQKLLDNAVKFTERGGITLALAGGEAAPGRIALHFSVRDSGIGIAAEQQQRIFEAFTQGDGSATRRYAGTGLGLTVAQRLAAGLGGKLWLESAPGQGTTFHFSAEFDIDVSLPADAVPPGLTFAAGEGVARSDAAMLGFDYRQALTRLDPDIADVVVPLFLQHCDEDIGRLAAALAAQDAPTTVHEAHALRGSLGAFGAEPASLLALRIEEAARGGELAAASALLPQLKDEVARFCTVLRAQA